jgi:hypothetical protein
MSLHDEWLARCKAEHQASVERGEHDERCEYGTKPNGSILLLCHCSKRRREAAGFTTPPDVDLYFPPPTCSHCDGDLDHDGDGWQCYECALSWDSNGRGSSCTFTDEFGDLSPASAEERRA